MTEAGSRTAVVIVMIIVLLIALSVIETSGTRSDMPVEIAPVPQSLFIPVRPVRPEATVAPTQAPRATIKPRPAPRSTPAPTRRPKPTQPPVAPRTTRSVSGVATWYCEPGVSICTNGYPAGGAYGAAGPELRAALGNWRGKTVYVNGIAVTLIDWCGCGDDHVIDVYHATWLTIPNPSNVEVRW
jgi:hypothetical protein